MTAAITHRSLFAVGMLPMLLLVCGLQGVFSSAVAAEGPPRNLPPSDAAVGESYAPPVAPTELLHLDQQTREYFRLRVRTHDRDEHQLREIVEAILAPEGLGFAYQHNATYGAQATFVRRGGNCVSFALLVVAVCRDQGFTARFHTIDMPYTWSRVGDHIVMYAHMNVHVEGRYETFLVDLRPDLVPPSRRRAGRVLTDAAAFALFYANIGFSHLLAGDTVEALRWTRHATQVDPNSADAWANCGTLHRKLGDLAAAREAFARAMRLDRSGDAAIVGYVDVLRRLGTPEDLRLAAKLERRARVLREANPYYHEALAQRAQAAGDWPAAERELRRAVDLKPEEPAFYAQWQLALQKLGRTKEAGRVAAKLEKLHRRTERESELWR